jgi:hypothetical protein
VPPAERPAGIPRSGADGRAGSVSPRPAAVARQTPDRIPDVREGSAVRGSSPTRSADPGRSGQPWRDRLAVPAAVAALTFVTALLVLFVGPDLGLADNGDGRRLMCQAAVAPVGAGTKEPAHFAYEPASAETVRTCSTDAWRYPTSWAPVVRAVVDVSRALSGSGSFDLRFLGVVAAALLAVATGVLAAVLRGPPWWRVLVAGGLGLAVLDTGLSSYLASPYTEPGGFVGLVLLLAAAVSYLTRPRVRGVDVVLLVAAAAFTGTVKAQLAPVLLVAAAVLLLRAAPTSRSSPGSRPGARSRTRRPWPLVGAVALVALTPVFLGQMGTEFSRVNQYHLLFTTVLADSDDPAETLAELGLPPELAPYAGTHAWARVNAFAEPSYDEVEERFTRGTVLRYWATHPAAALRVVGTATTQAAHTRVSYLPMTEDVAGPPVVVASRWAPGHLALAPFRAAPWPFLWLAWGAAFLTGTWLASGRDRGVAQRQVGALAALLAALAASQLAVAILGDGYYEIRKHLVFSSWAGVALAPVVLAMALSPLTARRARRAAVPARHRATPSA